MTEKVKIGTKEFRIVHNDDGTKDVSLKGKCGNKLATETGHFSVNFQHARDAFLSYSKLLHNSDFFTLSPHFHYLLQPIKYNGSKHQQP